MERQLSRYLRTKERNGYTAVFHELHPDPVYFPSNVWGEYLLGMLDGTSDSNAKVEDELTGKGLIISSSTDDNKEYRTVASKLETKLDQPLILYLMMTEGCNFGCKYCPFAKTKDGVNSRRLSINDAISGVNLWRAHLDEAYDQTMQYYVIFYGGEPLLGKDVIESTLEYIEYIKSQGNFPFDTKALLITNGALIDESVVRWYSRHKLEIAIGLDGPRTINDTLRISSNGQGTYDTIIRSIKLLTENGIQPSISTSITPYNLSSLDSLAELFLNLGVKKFGFNFLKGRELLELVPRNELDSYYREATLGIIRSYRLQPDHHFEYQMEKKVVAFDNQDFFPVDCTCYGNQIVITPSGQVSNCPFLRTPLGHVAELNTNFRIYRQPIVGKWRERLPLYHPAYRDFEAKALSGGGCAWSMGEIKGDISAIDDSSFISAREVLDELIWSRFKSLER